MTSCGRTRPQEEFDTSDPRCWLGRGRSIEHATELARIWQTYPDLPPTAPLDERMARGRERIAAMKPLNDAISARTEAERQARNFGFLEARVASGTVTDHELAIVRGRDEYCYDWDSAVAYATGWSAAHAGRDYRFYADGSKLQEAKRAAHDRGFADGGGDPTDIFDAARRSNLAALRQDNQRCVVVPPAARAPPSSWPKPSDHARPTRWSRRLLIVSDATIEEVTPGQMKVSGLLLVDEVLARGGTEAMTIVTIDRDAGFLAGACAVEAAVPITSARADEIIAADPRHGDALRAILAGREIDDILIAVQGDYLRIVDAFADSLPLCANMERTRNSLLQQRAHLRCWLDRGHDGTDNLGAGHIRWGKAIKGLTGKLGEFTARYVGPAPERGHLIVVEVENELPAHGYASSAGEPLRPEIIVSSKANIRREMAAALRAFGGATRLMDVRG